MIPGIDYLGGVNYIDVVTEHHPEGYAAGFLLKTSGWKNGIKAAKALAETGKCNTIRFHGLWLDDHGFDSKHIHDAVQQAKKVAKFQESFPEIKCFYSPWLEAYCNQALAKACRKACKNVLPKKIKIVGLGNCLSGVIREVHHSKITYDKHIFSYDGADMMRSDVQFDRCFHRGSEIFYLWIPACNGLKSLRDRTPRACRTSWLTSKNIKDMVRRFNNN